MQDFIEALLVKDVTKRLGCSPDGTPDYATLKVCVSVWMQSLQ